ncbi:MAG: hypothetical protein ACTSU4_05720 [Promethearchaeota archaeon]
MFYNEDISEVRRCMKFINCKLRSYHTGRILEKEYLQKIKYKLLSRLTCKLFLYKNSPSKYKTISNLIILVLDLFEDYPVDLFSDLKDMAPFSNKSKLNEILLNELKGFTHFN